MVHGVAVVWLPVSDLSEAVGFYSEKLGLKVETQEDDWAELEANGLRIGLNPSEDPSGGGGGVVAFQPDGGIEETVEELKGKGVDFPGDVSDFPWGRIAAFKDQDGNDLQLYEPPSS